MLRLSFGLVLSIVLSNSSVAADCPATLNFSLRPLAQETPVELCDQLAGKVVLIVNTASRCGFTPQYDGLEALYETYRERGLVVVGFPSNDFRQEPGDEAAIADFCRLTYDVKFPMFEKMNVTEQNAHPLYQELAKQGGGYPQWNFHKYLLDRDGKVVMSFQTRVTPQDSTLIEAIESLL